MSGALAIQTAIYSRLTNYTALTNLLSSDYSTTAVFDYVPERTDPESTDGFPYVVIGEDTMNPWDTNTETGTEATLTIHCWSVSGNFEEIKNIQQQIYNALHRYDGLTVSGYTVIGIDLEFQDSTRDPDSFTRHGVQRFRLVMDS